MKVHRLYAMGTQRGKNQIQLAALLYKLEKLIPADASELQAVKGLGVVL